MKKDQLFQEFYTQFLRLLADRNIPKEDLKEELNDKLSQKLQEAVAVYYNNQNIPTTRFAQNCTTIDQQIRNRTEKANRKGNQSRRSKSETEEPAKSKQDDSEKYKERVSFSSSSRDWRLIKYYNYNKISYIAKDYQALKKANNISKVEIASNSDIGKDCF